MPTTSVEQLTDAILARDHSRDDEGHERAPAELRARGVEPRGGADLMEEWIG
jgi:hypothetical protein